MTAHHTLLTWLSFTTELFTSIIRPIITELFTLSTMRSTITDVFTLPTMHPIITDVFTQSTTRSIITDLLLVFQEDEEPDLWEEKFKTHTDKKPNGKH